MVRANSKIQATNSDVTYLDNVISDIQEFNHQLNDHLLQLFKQRSEIGLMKNGSIAKIEQITTISKQRIYIPKNKNDLFMVYLFQRKQWKR